MGIATSDEPPLNRTMITVSVMLATSMTLLDSTIANVALPHMAGSLSASSDQISWVLTSYIIAAAIATPVSGWLAGRFGPKRMFAVMIVGFVLASTLCGAAQNLQQIVLFRVLQGCFGAAMMPMSQLVLLDIYPLEQRGPIMAVWGMGTVIAPILGPTLGGWLTDNYSWRWVFYINVPVGALSLAGVIAFLHDGGQRLARRFDGVGFAFLSIALAAFQLALDRGQGHDWFQSPEIVIEATVAGVAFILFVFHSLTSAQPFLPIELALDRNFMMSLLMSLMLGVLTFSVVALVPTMLESLMGFTVMDTGLLSSPRGIGSLLSFMAAGWLLGRVDDRLLVVGGLCLFAISYFAMSRFSLQTSADAFVWTSFMLGLGTGLAFMPMSVVAYATLDPSLRADAAGVFAVVRNAGNSAGISVMELMLTRNTAAVHSRLVEGLTKANPAAASPYLAAPFSLHNPVGIAALDGEVTRQASMVAYIDIFQSLALASLLAIPLAIFMNRPHERPPVELMAE